MILWFYDSMVQIVKKMSRDVPYDTMSVGYADYLHP